MPDPSPSNVPPKPPGPAKSVAAAPPKQPNPFAQVCVMCWRRRVLRFPLLVVFGLMLATTLLTQTPATKWWLIPVIERALGAEVEVRSVRVAGDGAVVLQDVIFTIPGIPGEASRLLEASRIRIGVDYTASGAARLRRVIFTEPTIRVGVNEEFDFNLQPLLGRELGRGSGGSLPTIEIHDGLLEVGEYTASGRYTPLRRVRVDGELRPADGRDPVLQGSEDGWAAVGTGYEIRLRDLDEADGPGQIGELDVSGSITDDWVQVEVANFNLAAWPASRAPSPVRAQLEQLNVQGAITRAEFGFGVDEGFVGRLDLDRVAVNLPFGLRTDASGKSARMRDVTGFVRFSELGLEADLSGELEDLPYRVLLAYEGLDVDAPFTATVESEGFRLEERPNLLPFVPEIVARNLELFKNPTALVDADVKVVRTEAGGEVDVSGTVQLTEGRAAYEGFAYPFENIDAVVSFDAESVSLDSFKGTAVNGAKIDAHGLFAPLGPTSGVDLHVHVEDVPIDRLLRDALGEEKQEFVNALFSEPKAAFLDAEGMFDDTTFRLGAVGDIDVHVKRQIGIESIWTRDIDVEFRDVNALSDYFPLPLFADRFALHINDERALIEPMTMYPISGGTATFEGVVPLSDDPDQSDPPDIRITVDNAVWDEFAIRAIPDEDPGGPASVRRMLRALNGSGTIDAAARVLGRPGGEIGFEADIDLAGIDVSPLARDPRTDPRLLLRSSGGMMRVTESGLTLSVAADAERLDGGSRRGAGRAEIDAQAWFTPGEDARVVSTVRGTDIDVGARIEDLTKAFNAEASQALADLRALWDPSGYADVLVAVDTQGDARGPLTVVDVLRTEAADVAVAGGRLGIDTTAGTVRARVREEITTVTFLGTEANLAWNGDPFGSGWLSGTTAFDEYGFSMGGWSLDGAVLGVEASNPVARAMLVEYAPPDSVRVYDDLAPTGIVDIEANLAPGPILDGTMGQRLVGRVYPTAAEITFNGDRIASQDTRGAMTFAPEGVGFESLTAFGPDWRVIVEGTIGAIADGGATMEIDVALDADSLGDDIRVLIPPDLREVMEKLEIEVGGPVSVGGLHVSARRDGATGEAWSRAEGTLTGEDASIKVGVGITEGSVAVSFDSFIAAWPGEVTTKQPEFRLEAFASKALVQGVDATELGAVVRTGDPLSNGLNPLLIPYFGGSCHDGRISGQALVRPKSEDRARIEGDVRFSGLELAGVLSDMERSRAIEAGEEPSASEPGSGPQGRLDGQITFGGVPEEPEGWQGRGLFRASGGPLVLLPVVLPLLEVGNLTPPRGAQLDVATVSFYMDGPVVAFEDLSLMSDTLLVLGHGTMTLPEAEIDLRFRTQARSRVPVISAVVDTLKDELLNARVTGTLAEPRFQTQPLGSTRQALARMFGASTEDEASQRMDEIERVARQRSGNRGALRSGAPVEPSGRFGEAQGDDGQESGE
ncbi:MAG: hypothetical protein AAGB51_08145 [Planctomycetota bacterium]